MSEAQFPSGLWTGFYNYVPGDRHSMQLRLEFSAGAMHGDGVDDIGSFAIRGRYDTSSLECSWTKTYPGSHDVSYRGFREGKGIWGTWEIGLFARGGFHIWPKETGESERETATQNEPVEAVANIELPETVPPQTSKPHSYDTRSSLT
jgi:hypothetical protein